MEHLTFEKVKLQSTLDLIYNSFHAEESVFLLYHTFLDMKECRLGFSLDFLVRTKKVFLVFAV